MHIKGSKAKKEMASTEDGSLTRAELPVDRRHGKFLLKELHFTQQYSHMYYYRLSQLQSRCRDALKRRFDSGQLATAPYSRVLDLPIGKRCMCIGTVFKSLTGFRGFLCEYTKELVRLEAGDEDDGEEEEGFGVDVADLAPSVQAPPSAGLCGPSDFLILEDESGRVELLGDAVPTAQLVTGVVIAVIGELQDKGKLRVEAWMPCGAPPQPPRSLPADLPAAPAYIGMVCGLATSAASTVAHLNLLLDYVSGNVSGCSQQAARIGRLIVGGNLIESTEDMRLRLKVKLEPSDHARLSENTTNTAARCMQTVDAALSQLAECIELDILPGENDPANTFWPQQPLHPLLLKATSRKSTVHLVTNPFEIESRADHSTFLFTAGQNVDDVCKQCSFTPIESMESMMQWGTMCPTAPNTLACYPFREADPFILTETPHCFVAFNQPTFSSKLVELPSQSFCRLITVPSFAQSGLLVLVNIHSPTLEATTVKFL